MNSSSSLAAKTLGILAVLFMTATAINGQTSEPDSILARCSMTVNAPSEAKTGFFTMDNSPVMGNGCLMITAGSTANSLTFYLGKTDFWRDKCNEDTNDGWQSANVLPGYLRLTFPALTNAAFKQTLDLGLAEIKTSMRHGEESVEIRSVTPHPADNYLVNEILNTGKKAVVIEVATVTDQYRIKSDPFEIRSGKTTGSEPVAWVSRKTNVPPSHDDYGSREFRMWAAVGTRILGNPATVSCDNQWSYEAGEMDVRTVSSITVNPGKKVFVVTKVHSTGIPVTMTPADPLPVTLKDLQAMNRSSVEKMIVSHREWWKNYWNKSFIDLKSERLVERVYYGALYVFACANKPGQWPAGCNGWPINDVVPWGGD
jgi:hypothetical protein